MELDTAGETVFEADPVVVVVNSSLSFVVVVVVVVNFFVMVVCSTSVMIVVAGFTAAAAAGAAELAVVVAGASAAAVVVVGCFCFLACLASFFASLSAIICSRLFSAGAGDAAAFCCWLLLAFGIAAASSVSPNRFRLFLGRLRWRCFFCLETTEVVELYRTKGNINIIA